MDKVYQDKLKSIESIIKDLQEEMKKDFLWRQFLESWIDRTFGYNIREEFDQNNCIIKDTKSHFPSIYYDDEDLIERDEVMSEAGPSIIQLVDLGLAEQEQVQLEISPFSCDNSDNNNANNNDTQVKTEEDGDVIMQILNYETASKSTIKSTPVCAASKDKGVIDKSKIKKRKNPPPILPVICNKKQQESYTNKDFEETSRKVGGAGDEKSQSQTESLIIQKRGANLKKMMKPIPCSANCHNNCRSWNEEDRKAIFRFYWNLGDIQKEREWIKSNVKKGPVKRKRSKDSNFRLQTLQYFLPQLSTQQGPRRVCKGFFYSTLGIAHTFTEKLKL